MQVISCHLERYARCYHRYEEQYSDVNGRPLYALMPMMHAQATTQQQTSAFSQHVSAIVHAGTWTAIPASEDLKLYLDISIESATSCTLFVKATKDGNIFILVQ